MTKRVNSDRRPYDTRPVSRIRLDKVVSQDALDSLSRYEEVNRQFAQEFPQMACNLRHLSWIPWFLSPHTEAQENKIAAAPADNATSTGDPASHMPTCDFDFTTSAGCSLSIHNNASDSDILSTIVTSLTTAATTPESSDNSDPHTPIDVDFYPSYDLDALSSPLPWHDQDQPQESGHGHAVHGQIGGGTEEYWDESYLMSSTSRFRQAVEQSTMLSPGGGGGGGGGGGESSDYDNEALAEQSCLDNKKMNQIMVNLNRLGSRLREDARRQLDVISDDCAGFPTWS
ncbi:hypothetical protein V8C37DRAFT_374854 [Trichoderma ceciliae]